MIINHTFFSKGTKLLPSTKTGNLVSHCEIILECNFCQDLEWSMAKGWESKSVEEQQSQATSASTSKSSKPQLTPAQITQKQMRNGLELSRQRVLQQLQGACNPNHRSMLEKALADLNGQLEKLG